MVEHANAADPASPASSGGIQVISRAARILRALRDEPDGLSLGQIALRVGLPRSTVQRIVTALAAERLLIAATPGARVRIGPEIVALAATARVETIALIHPLLKALSDETDETVDLAVFRKDHLVFVDQVPGSQRLRAVSAVGETFPLDSTANGKAVLALLPRDDVAERLGPALEVTLAKRGRTLASLFRELETVRKRGVAFDEEEHSRGIAAVGAAFRDGTGAIYAISVPAPAARFSESRDILARKLLATRQAVVRQLGAEDGQEQPAGRNGR